MSITTYYHFVDHYFDHPGGLANVIMRTMFPDDMDKVESDGYYGKATDVMDGFKTTTSPSGMYVKQIKPEDRMVATGIERPTGVQSYSIAFLEKGE